MKRPSMALCLRIRRTFRKRLFFISRGTVKVIVRELLSHYDNDHTYVLKQVEQQ